MKFILLFYCINVLLLQQSTAFLYSNYIVKDQNYIEHLHFYELDAFILDLIENIDSDGAYWHVNVISLPYGYRTSVGNIRDDKKVEIFSLNSYHYITTVSASYIGYFESLEIYAQTISTAIYTFMNGRRIILYPFIGVYDITSLIEMQNALIYFGRPTCPACAVFTPIIFDIALRTQKNIYYVNTDRWRMDEGFSQLVDTFNLTHVPHLIYLNQGDTMILFNGFVENWHILLEKEIVVLERFSNKNAGI